MKIWKPAVLHFFTFFFFSIFSAIDTPTSSHPLSNGETLISTNENLALSIFTPPDTTSRYLDIWYHNLAVHTGVWVANRRNPISNRDSTSSVIGQNESLHLITSGNSTPLWFSPSFPDSNPNRFGQLISGTFVVELPNSNSISCQRFDYPIDTLLRWMRFSHTLKIGMDYSLVSWLSSSDSSVEYALASLKKWDVDCFVPNDDCDSFPACGTTTTCDPSWRRGNGSDGCVRAAALAFELHGADDDFIAVIYSNLSDMTEAAIDTRWELYSIVAEAIVCSGNCSELATHMSLTYAEVSTSGDQQELFGRVLSSVDGPNAGRKRRTWIFVLVVAILLLLLALIFILVLWRWRHRAFSLNLVDKITQKLKAGKDEKPKISLFQFSQLEIATNNFSITNKLGEGGFGPVYKGELSEGEVVAIKKLSARSKQGLVELKNEILLLAKLQHRNLVRLLGYCIHREEKMLIYEFMPNKSLDLWIFNVGQRLKLDWTRRFEIIEGIAQGLLYLHKQSRLSVIHRDLKASNILLDVDMNPRISDFGMARIFNSNETQLNTQRIVGTYGYMPPEYCFNGLFSIKSDVFSFGVLLLEIVSGKRNTNFCESDSPYNLISYAWDLWSNGTWVELVDPALDNKFKHDEVTRCIYVALQCVQEIPDDRPDTSDIIAILSSESLCFNHIKQPAFFFMKNAIEPKLPPNLHANSSINSLSLSVIVGR